VCVYERESARMRGSGQGGVAVCVCVCVCVIMRQCVSECRKERVCEVVVKVVWPCVCVCVCVIMRHCVCRNAGNREYVR